jgi:hypothetical protein
MVQSIARALVLAGVAACVAAPSFAQDQSSSTGTMDYSMSRSGTRMDHDGWSRSYRLTPVDQKRFRAMGLTDKEVYVVANTAHETAMDPDAIVQMIFRGATVASIAEQFNLSPTALVTPRPEWTTPEWEQAVQHGSPWPMYMSGDRGMGNGERGMRRERRERGRMNGQGSQGTSGNDTNQGTGTGR